MTGFEISRRAMMNGIAATVAVSTCGPAWAQAKAKPRALALVGDRYHNPDYIRVSLDKVFHELDIPVDYTMDYASLSAALLKPYQLFLVLRDGMIWPGGYSGPDALKMLGETLPQLEAIHDAVTPDTFFLRYEDLIEHPAAARSALYRFIGIDPGGGDFIDADTDLFRAHGTSRDPAASIGRWRTVEGGTAIDASGSLPDGSQFADVHGLEQALLKRPEIFVGRNSDSDERVRPYGGPNAGDDLPDDTAAIFECSSIKVVASVEGRAQE